MRLYTNHEVQYIKIRAKGICQEEGGSKQAPIESAKLPMGVVCAFAHLGYRTIFSIYCLNWFICFILNLLLFKYCLLAPYHDGVVELNSCNQSSTSRRHERDHCPCSGYLK